MDTFAQRPDHRSRRGSPGAAAARPAATVAGRLEHPLLGLQRLAGNNAVQDLLRADGFAVQDLARSPGVALAPSLRAVMEARLGHDLGHVRIHSGAPAALSARALGVPAYTVGSHIVFDTGQFAPHRAQGQAVLAHELTHAVQQDHAEAGAGVVLGRPGDAHERQARQIAEGASTTVVVPASSPLGIQRYEAGEHVQLGETSAELGALVADRTFSYRVNPGDTLRGIAARFSVRVEDLRRLNAAKLRRWPAVAGTGEVVTGFEAGEEVQIPVVFNSAVQQAVKTGDLSFTVKGRKLAYGVGIAMGDLFESPEQMAAASADELDAIAKLIEAERKGATVTVEQWQTATNQRYLRLAERNEAHFAPPDVALVPASGRPSPDHKTQWERYHQQALQLSQTGDKDEALRVNAFADHFLTDAFAGGHLVNKRDVMQRFQQNLPLTAEGEFTPDANAFFDQVARQAFVGAVRTEFSRHETVEFHGGIFRPNINSASRFADLLRGIHRQEPDLLANAITRAVHNTLNLEPGGIPVANARGDPEWKLSGDGTLNAESTAMARRAVAQSQLNVLGAYRMMGPLDLPALFKQVWDYVPRPTAVGATRVREAVTVGTDPRQAALVQAVVDLITQNHLVILRELVARGILKPA